MKDKMETFNQDEELRLAAFNREMNRVAHEGEKQDAYIEGKAEGLKEGKAEGLKEGAINEKILFIQTRYGKVETDWLKSLNEKQLESINDIIFKENNYELFKQKVKGTE